MTRSGSVARTFQPLVGAVNTHVRLAVYEDTSAISGLVRDSFNRHVADDREQAAREHFMSETTADKLAGAIADAAFIAVYEDLGRMLGVIWLPRPALVQFVFVAPGHLRRGIGRVLWESALAYIRERHPEVSTVELNAPSFAVPAYQALGFFPISKPFRRGGVVATRMACWLPGALLESAG